MCNHYIVALYLYYNPGIGPGAYSSSIHYIPQGQWLAIWTIKHHMCRILASVSIMFGYSKMNN